MRAVSLCRLQREMPELQYSATPAQFPLGLVNTQESDLKLSFHGADRSVTGSCHLVECAGKRILIDCGLRQGSRELDEENAGPFGFDAAAIDYVMLTHAHLDHCGRLPLLAKRGFRGEIITTSASRELARLIMLDSAHQQEEDVRHRARRVGHGASNDNKQPLYSTLDAQNCLNYFGRTATYDQAFEVVAGVRATFIDAGHILGSASIFLELEETGHATSLLFSGDLGSTTRVLLRSPAKPPHAENVVMETTYGDRLHKQLGPSIDEFYGAITETFKRGGNVIIPTFALERAQELLYYLSEGVAHGRLTKSTQVYLDSPMAISATEIFRRHPECFEPATAKLFQEGHDPLALPGLHFTRETAESVAINSVRGGAIIMAGSGMCTGGRVRHHLQHNLGREDSSIVFVGYAAIGTLARQIIDGTKNVNIFGEDIPVRARIYTINGFSAHADQTELLAWQKQTGAKRTFLVHGEEDTMRQFAAHLVDTRVEMPEPNQVFEL
jgi:metallo-beta-lactamase family protein